MSTPIFSFLAALPLALACVGERPPAESPPPDPWALLLERGGITAYVDTIHITLDGSVARVWLRFDHDQLMPKMESTTGPWSRMEAQTDIDCRALRARDVALRLMDSTGAVVGDTMWGPGEWQAFAEHTLGAHLLQPACDRIAKGRAA